MFCYLATVVRSRVLGFKFGGLCALPYNFCQGRDAVKSEAYTQRGKVRRKAVDNYKRDARTDGPSKEKPLIG